MIPSKKIVIEYSTEYDVCAGIEAAWVVFVETPIVIATEIVSAQVRMAKTIIELYCPGDDNLGDC